MPVDFDAASKPRKATALTAPLDLQPIRDQLAVYDGQIEELGGKANALEVITENSNLIAVELAGRSRKIWKALEEERKRLIGPASEFVKAINGLTKAYQARFEGIGTGLKGKIGQYQSRLELERRKKEAAEREAAAKLQEKLNKEAEELDLEPVTVAKPVVADAPTAVRAESGTSFQRKTWVFEIEDESKIPFEYMVPNEKAIRQAVKGGVRKIPGVKIYQESKTEIRT